MAREACYCILSDKQDVVFEPLRYCAMQVLHKRESEHDFSWNVHVHRPVDLQKRHLG